MLNVTSVSLRGKNNTGETLIYIFHVYKKNLKGTRNSVGQFQNLSVHHLTWYRTLATNLHLESSPSKAQTIEFLLPSTNKLK